jgi:hypothetical protein
MYFSKLILKWTGIYFYHLFEITVRIKPMGNSIEYNVCYDFKLSLFDSVM